MNCNGMFFSRKRHNKLYYFQHLLLNVSFCSLRSCTTNCACRYWRVVEWVLHWRKKSLVCMWACQSYSARVGARHKHIHNVHNGTFLNIMAKHIPLYSSRDQNIFCNWPVNTYHHGACVLVSFQFVFWRFNVRSRAHFFCSRLCAFGIFKSY